jgi:hypothetical protein
VQLGVLLADGVPPPPVAWFELLEHADSSSANATVTSSDFRT